MKTQTSTSTCSEQKDQISQGEKRVAAEIIPNHFPYIKLLKIEYVRMHRGIGEVLHVNELSSHAISMCSLSEEHQSLAGIKMILLKLHSPSRCSTHPRLPLH